MNRRTLLSMLASMLVTTVMMFAGANSASAQNPLCCHFTINTTLVRPACFPLVVTTMWGGGMTHSQAITGPGFVSVPIPGPCPPARPLLSVTVTSPVGCCYTWTVDYCNGCPTITIVSC